MMATETIPAQTIPQITWYICDCCERRSTRMDFLTHRFVLENKSAYRIQKLEYCTPCGTQVIDHTSRYLASLRESQQKA